MAPAFSVHRFREQLRTSWIGHELRYEATVGSTMDLARSLGHNGAPNGTVVLAEEQTLGRGRLGRRWISPYGANLYLSVLLFPDLTQLRSLAMVAPLAIAEGVGRATGLDCTIKWPNDVQIHGKKLAGVLLESELAGGRPAVAIAGLGVNVNFDPSAERELAAIATSVSSEAGAFVDRESLLARCLEAFERLYESPADSIRDAWRLRLNTLGQPVRVTFHGEHEEGVAEDVDADGSLILRRDDGSRLTLAAGEVSLRT